MLKELRVKWIINIDNVSDEDVKDTENNLREILSDENIDLEIFHSTPPCIFKAVKMLSYEAYKYLDETKYGVFWLEDDWPLIRDPSKLNLKKLLDKCLVSDGDYITFRGRDRLNLMPGIFSNYLFKKNFIERFKENT